MRRLTIKDNVTKHMFTPPAERPRKFKDHAEKMRAYRREKRIKFLMDLKKCNKEQAEEYIERGYRVNSWYY